MSQQLTYEQFVVAEVRRREETDYRFSYWSYLGWTILTLGIYGHYATYKLVERRTSHAQRRLAFQSYLWHALNARVEAAGQKEIVSEGLDNLSRIYQQMDAFERRNKREPVLWMLLRLAMAIFFLPVVGAYINHFLNKDLQFYDEWEASYAANAEWVMQRLGYPVVLPRRARPVPNRSTGLYVFLSIITFGIFGMFWRYSVMVDGNGHFDDDAAMEDALLAGLGLAPATAAWPPPGGLLPAPGVAPPPAGALPPAGPPPAGGSPPPGPSV